MLIFIMILFYFINFLFSTIYYIMFNSGFTNKIAYKVVRPYTSQKLHYSLSLQGGASKCYREVKSLMPNTNDFSIMNMNTNEIMDYKMNKLPTQQAQHSQQAGGILPSLDMKKLEDKIESLEARLKRLEDGNGGNGDNKKPVETSPKLDTNKLDTNKLDTNKLDTNKLDTNKLDTNKLDTNRIEPGPINDNSANNHSAFVKAFF